MARGKARGKGRTGPTRRPQGGEDEGADRWLGTYGDAVTLLLAFFVMLYSMSSIDAAKFSEVAAALSAALGKPAGGEGLLDAQPAIVGPDVPAPAEPAFEPVAPPEPELTADLEAAAELAAELERSLVEAGLPEVAGIVVDGDVVIVRIGTDDVLFETGSAVVGETGRRIVAAIGPTIAGSPHAVRIEGHTDDVPLRRGGYTNWNLSTDRAVAVLTLLETRYAVAPRRLTAVGHGEHVPIAPNDSRAERALNRRVEIVLTPPRGADT